MKQGSLALIQKLVLVGSPLLMLASLVAPEVQAAPVAAVTHQKPFYRSNGHTIKPQVAGAITVVNAASYLAGVCPGGIVTIFGTGLSLVTDIEGATTNPLPTQIADVVVQVNGIPAPLYYVAFVSGGDQIAIQVPYGTPVGLGAVQVDVFSNGTLVGTTVTDSYTEDPGIFLYSSGSINNYAVALHADYALITTDDPALPGETIIVYATGLGPLNLSLEDGVGAPSSPLAETIDPFTALVNSEDCAVYFSGLAPGFVGLYQLNLTLPSDLPAGPLNMQITTQYASSGIAILPVS